QPGRESLGWGGGNGDLCGGLHQFNCDSGEFIGDRYLNAYWFARIESDIASRAFAAWCWLRSRGSRKRRRHRGSRRLRSSSTGFSRRWSRSEARSRKRRNPISPHSIGCGFKKISRQPAKLAASSRRSRGVGDVGANVL